MSHGIYEKESLVKHMNQQIIVNRDLIHALEIIIPIINKFDGKKLDKRIQTAVNDELSKTFKNGAIYLGMMFSDSRWVDLYVRDHDCYTVRAHEDGNGRTVNYVDYKHNFSISFDADMRIDACKTNKELTGIISSLTKQNNQFNNELEYMDESIAVYKDLQKSIDDYNDSFSYLFREVFKIH